MSFEDLLGSLDDDDDDEGAPFGRNFSLATKDAHLLDRGVPIPWLCQAFNLTRHKVETLLRGAPVLRHGGRGARIYDLSVAASYLVKPRVNMREYLKGLNPRELPEHLRSEFWASRLKEQKARANAKELWRTEDVQIAFSEYNKSISDTVKLWTDEIAESQDLTPQLIEILDDKARDLLTMIGDAALAYAEGRATPSQEAEFPETSLDVP